MLSQALATPLAAPLVDRVLPGRRGRLRVVVQVLAGVAFLTALAQIRLQIGPVPVTGQTLGVLLLGAAYGVRAGVGTTALYVLLGGLGLPLFTGWNAGFAYLAGPTGGYLLGFVVAAALLGWFAQRGWDRAYGSTAVAMAVASLAIYLPGLVWLKYAVLHTSWSQTLALGLLPFLLGDAVKLVVAVALLPTVWRMLGER